MAAPALFLAIPLVLGVLIGTASADASAPLGVAGLLACWASSLASVRCRLRTAASVSIAGGCVLAGLVIGARAQDEADTPSLAAWYRLAQRSAQREGWPVRLTGVLREDAAASPHAGVSLTLDAVSANGDPVDGGVRLTVAGALAAAQSGQWRAGRTVTVNVALREPLDYRDPGVPSDRARLARQGIVLVGTVKSAALVNVDARGGPAAEAAAALRAWVRGGTTAAVGRWSAASAGVVTAILIGDRGGLSAADERRLQEAGTYHVIAISGGNIALLTALLVALGRAARLPRRPTALVSIGVLAFYGYAAGLAPSVMRATVAGMIYLAARAADHRGAALNAIGVAAAFAAATAPLSLLDPGFVLSFGATFAIVAAVRRFAPPPTKRSERPRGRAARALGAVLFGARMLGAATLCAEIALAPIGARLFGRVSLAGLLLNFIAIPLMSVIQVAGVAAVCLEAVSGSLAAAAGWIAHVATAALLRSAALVDVAPWLVIDVPPPAWWVMACWYAGWAAIFVSRRRWLRIASTAAIAIAAVPAVAGLPAAAAVRVPPPPPGWTRVVFLDVGQGDAALLVPAGVPSIIVDTGGAPGSSFDLGRRVTLPAAWAFGARRLSALVLTHGDPDHIGGAPALLRALRPREIWEGVPVPGHEPLQRLRAAAERAGIAWATRSAGATLAAGPLTLRVLHPPAPDWERRRVRNDDSIVLEARAGGVAFLLTGDITQAVERDLIPHLDPAPLTIVKAPHHGSAGSSSAAFVDALRPVVAIFSAGRRNPFGHPAPAVVARYRAAGARVFSTADDGAVVVDTDGVHVVVWCPATGRRDVLTARGR
jgi:competence protein ComEC